MVILDKPWYRSQSASGNCSDLCHVCSEINFEWLINNEITGYNFRSYTPGNATNNPLKHAVKDFPQERVVDVNIPELSLGFLTDIFHRRERCNFCQLIILTISVGCETDAGKVLEFDFGNCLAENVYVTLWNEPKIEAQALDELEPTREILILLRDIRGVTTNFQAFKKLSIHRINEEYVPFEGAKVCDQVDLEAARKWISQFDLPPYMSDVPHEPLDGFRVIDVQQDCVIPVHGPQGCRYLALSYVWGGDQKFKNLKARDAALRQPGSLSDAQSLPQTISDAIFFTKAIGERYLWVDSLCIIQDDERKMTQISAMDQIYGCAVVTIIAAYGVNAHAGLPGVRPESGGRWKQHIVDIHGMQLANRQTFLPGFGPNTWHQRAWTYQEEVLSLRTIQFALDGAHFASEDGLLAEDLHLPQHNKKNKPTLKALGVPGVRNVKEEGVFPNRELYGLSAMFYTLKQMSFQSDGLNAFTGVLNMMQPAFRRNFLYGLPSSELEYALLWKPRLPLSRRLDDTTLEPLFPTWSWVGWKGSMVLPLHSVTKFSRVIWVDAEDETEFTTDEWRGVDLGTIGSEESKWKQLPNPRSRLYFEEENPDVLFAHPVSQEIPGHMASRKFLTPGSHILKFQAFTASVRGRRATTTDVVIDPTVSFFELFDQYNHSCGGVYLHESRQLESGETVRFFESIAISRTASEEELEIPIEAPSQNDEDILAGMAEYATKQQIKNDRGAASYFALAEIEEPKWRMYDVLVVEWIENVAYRLGVGQCNVEAFWDAHPVRKRISLC